MQSHLLRQFKDSLVGLQSETHASYDPQTTCVAIDPDFWTLQILQHKPLENLHTSDLSTGALWRMRF